MFSYKKDHICACVRVCAHVLVCVYIRLVAQAYNVNSQKTSIGETKVQGQPELHNETLALIVTSKLTLINNKSHLSYLKMTESHRSWVV